MKTLRVLLLVGLSVIFSVVGFAADFRQIIKELFVSLFVSAKVSWFSLAKQAATLPDKLVIMLQYIAGKRGFCVGGNFLAGVTPLLPDITAA